MSDRAATSPAYEKALHEAVADYYDDPLGFILAMWPWGEPGPLQPYDGPDVWQEQLCKQIEEQLLSRTFDGHTPVQAVRAAVSSGHGVGKSALIAMLAHWLMATRPYMVGTITASSLPQLDTKTWPALVEWNRMCRVGHWFDINTERMCRVGYKDEWFIAKQSSKEENAASFAGQHKARSSPVYFFDEDSEICDLVHEVAEGGLTDGEPFIFRFGNMTIAQGSFYQAVFGNMRHRWNPIIVDSRTSRFTNKAQIAEWIADYGLDSDFVRVRVLGLAPAAGQFQFIDRATVEAAQRRPVLELPDTPLVAGCDLAWGGADDNVIRFRRGMDARSIPPIRIKGEFTRDPIVLITKLSEVLTNTYDGRKVSALFLDSAGIAGPVAKRLRELGHDSIQEVNFGAHSPDRQCRFYRDFMWQRMKDAMRTLAIDTDEQLAADLTGPGLRPDTQQRIWLESKESMKKRGVDSPDDADALALTFAAEVTVERPRATIEDFGYTGGVASWMSQ